MNEILLTVNSDSIMEMYEEPYATIEVESEEELNRIQEAINYTTKSKKATRS